MSRDTQPTGLTTRVADYALRLSPEALSREVIERTKQLLLDFLGVALGATTRWPLAGATVEGVRRLAGGAVGRSAVVGQDGRYLAQHAALLNAALAHSMDFDDTHREAIMHLGTPLFAALLAAGDDASGLEFLTAAVAGYEISAKLGLAHLDRVHLRGFHPTATTGIFAASAAAGRLMRLPRQTIEDALGLDLSMAAGTQQFAEGGGANKPLQVGLAAHNAIVALVLAEAGLPGATQPLEGRLGYYAMYAEPGSDVDGIYLDLESPDEVLRVGLKPYPCCRYIHGTIDGVLALRAREQLRPDEIETIEVTIPPAGFRLVGDQPEIKRRPPGTVDAQFSAYFGAAVAASEGAYSWESYERLNDPALQRLMDKVTVRASGELADMHTQLRITTGRNAWSLDLPLPKGEPELPLTWGEIESKFLMLGAGVLEPAKLRQIVATVHGLDRLSRVSQLTALLRPKG